MTSTSEQNVYVLSYRRDNIEEDHRLNSQHEVIKHAILNGELIHPSIRNIGPGSAIADLGCGTGIWLDDVATTLFANGRSAKDDPATLIGFDLNAHAFNPNPAPGVQLIQHDCTKPFEAQYIGKFDLVNVRGLAYAVPGEKFSRLVEHATQLLSEVEAAALAVSDVLKPVLGPGGYLQWLETEARLWRAFPDTTEISKALNIMNTERQERGLVAYLPHFMLRQFLSPHLASDVLQAHTNENAMTIINFNLLPAGLNKDPRFHDTSMNEHFSNVVLESINLLLKASILRKQSQVIDESQVRDGDLDDSEMSEMQRLMDFIDEARKCNTVKMGGAFPQLIAQKATLTSS